MSYVFADIIRARHDTLRGIVEGSMWPPVSLHRPPNCKKCSFLKKLTAPCVRTVGHGGVFLSSLGSWIWGPGVHPRRRQTPTFADRTTSYTPSVFICPVVLMSVPLSRANMDSSARQAAGDKSVTHMLRRKPSSSSSSSSSSSKAGRRQTPLCPHHKQTCSITYTY